MSLLFCFDTEIHALVHDHKTMPSNDRRSEIKVKIERETSVVKEFALQSLFRSNMMATIDRIIMRCTRSYSFAGKYNSSFGVPLSFLNSYKRNNFVYRLSPHGEDVSIPRCSFNSFIVFSYHFHMFEQNWQNLTRKP